MTTGAVDRVFVDTNVLVFSSVVTAPLHAAAAQALNDLWSAGVELLLSRQILREFIVATMLHHVVPKLLTHNTADFARFSSFITVLPLVP